MLLAALGAARAHGAGAIDQVSREWGPPKTVVYRAGAALGAWDCPAGLLANGRDGWFAEGWLDLGVADLSPGSLQHARGDFALVALHAGGLLLASGRAGGYRPIFVASPSPELVVACTRLSPLLAFLPRTPPLDLEYLAAALTFGPRSPELTPYQGVQRVRPGEAWFVCPGAPQQRWSTVAPLIERELRDNGDLAVRLRRAITDATARSTRNATKLGVLVSGGLDSSMLLSLLVSLARTGEISAPPEAIAYESAVPAWHDDRPHLRALEGYVDIRAHRILPADAAPFVGQRMVVDAMPAPFPMILAASPVGAFAKTHAIDVILTGDGGDLVLDGSPRLFGEVARKGEILRALKGALRTRGAFDHGQVGRLARFFMVPLLEPVLPRPALRAWRRLRRQGPPRWAGAAFARHAVHRATPPQTPATLGESPSDRYARFLRWQTWGCWSLIRQQEEVVGGYTLRSPLLDDDFIRFAATLPPLSLMHGGFLRGLMRDAMHDLVPKDLRLRETKGTFHWFIEQAIEKGGGVDALASLVDVRLLAKTGLVNPKSFRTFFNEFAEGSGDDIKYPNYADLWCVLSAEAFLRQHAGESPTGET